MTKRPSGTFYRHILADAWAVLKRNKALWMLGFFVSFLGNGGVYELLIQGTGKLGLQQDFGGFTAMAGLVPLVPQLLGLIGQVQPGEALVGIAAALIMLSLTAVTVWAVVSSQAGLILGIRDAYKEKEIGFGKLFSAGSERFWPFLALNVLSRLAIAALFYLLLSFLLLFLADATLWTSLLYLLAFVVLIPLTLIVGFVTIYAACYMALQRLTFVEAIVAAVGLFRSYWLVSLETALILFGINILSAIGLGVAVLGLAVLLMPFLVAGSILTGGLGAAAVIVVGALLGVSLMIVVGAGLGAFQYAVWTHLFLKLHTRGHGGVAKIVRWFRHLLA